MTGSLAWALGLAGAGAVLLVLGVYVEGAIVLAVAAFLGLRGARR